MGNIVCDVCGGTAVFHSTAVDNGRKTESHLCAAHAAEVGLTTPTGTSPSSGGPTWKAIVDNLRGTANFTRRHGRPPESVPELQEGMDLEQGTFPAVAIADAQLEEAVGRMERLIGFCRTHNRMPSTSQEWAQFGVDIA